MPKAVRRYARGCVVALVAVLSVSAARADDALGTETYNTTCAACHQPTGLGLPGAIPPLAGHAPAILSQPGGRDYLVRLVLYGLEGEITVDGHTFNSAMPPWADVLSDDQLATVLNHVLHTWDNEKALPPGFTPFAPAEIAAARATKLTAAQVYALRGQAPAATTMVPVSFTDEQTARGQATYRRACQDCHGYNLNDGEFGGAPLNGQYFARHWGGGSVAALYGYMASKMPPDRPGKLNPETYADLTAYLLAKNGYAPGATELPPDVDAQRRMSLKR